LPHPVFSGRQAENVERCKDVAERGPITACAKPQQKVRPTEKLRNRSEADKVDVVLQSGERCSQPHRVRAADERQIISKDKAVLRNCSRKSGGDANGSKNIQAGKLIIVTHFSFSNSNVGPFECSGGFGAGSRAEIANPCEVERSITEAVSVCQRK